MGAEGSCLEISCVGLWGRAVNASPCLQHSVTLTDGEGEGRMYLLLKLLPCLNISAVLSLPLAPAWV